MIWYDMIWICFSIIIDEHLSRVTSTNSIGVLGWNMSPNCSLVGWLLVPAKDNLGGVFLRRASPWYVRSLFSSFLSFVVRSEVERLPRKGQPAFPAILSNFSVINNLSILLVCPLHASYASCENGRCYPDHPVPCLLEQSSCSIFFLSKKSSFWCWTHQYCTHLQRETGAWSWNFFLITELVWSLPSSSSSSSCDTMQ